MLRIFGKVAATALVLAFVPPISASAVQTERPGKPGKPKVTITVPAEVIEGEQVPVEVKIGRTEDAKQVQLQQLVVQLGSPTWQTVAKTRARKKKGYRFQAIAGEDDTLQLRARVVYRTGRPAMSTPVVSTVWHWTRLADFPPYSHTSGVNDTGISSFTVNGQSFHGWFTTGALKSWESRFTPGRHCKAMRGVAGVRDESADGSTALVQVLADDATVYASPPLTPGTSQPFQVDLALPFRLAIQAQNTSLTALSTYPAIGNPELLCTGLG